MVYLHFLNGLAGVAVTSAAVAAGLVGLFLVILALFILRVYCLSWWRRQTHSLTDLNCPAALRKANSPLTWSAKKLAEMIRNMELTSEQVVELHIQHLLEVNPLLNAAVQYRFELARQEAKEADARIRNAKDKSKLPPFLGVPISVKECFGMKGMLWTSGLVSRLVKRITASADADAVERLMRAGFVVISRGNTSELCMWCESSNFAYGCTNNPYDANCHVGGSSGGEACLVSACCAPVGLGSDVGGSIRLPSFFNGVFGHKASWGLVNNEGQHPVTEGEGHQLLSTGPIARHAEDLYPVLTLLATKPIPNPSSVDLKKLRVVLVQPNFRWPVPKPDTDIMSTILRGASALQRAGCKVEPPVTIDLLQHGTDIWAACMNKWHSKPFKELMEDGDENERFHSLWELLKGMFGFSQHTVPAIVLALLDPFVAKFGKRNDAFVELRHKLLQQLEDLLAGDAVLLFPTQPRSTMPHHKILFRIHSFAYTATFNALGLPSTQVPMGLNSKGLPLGLQVIAGHGKDHLCLAVAEFFDRHIEGGWVPPSLSKTHQFYSFPI